MQCELEFSQGLVQFIQQCLDISIIPEVITLSKIVSWSDCIGNETVVGISCEIGKRGGSG